MTDERGGPPSPVTVRTYTSGDHPALVSLFERAGADSPTGELWGHAASERAVYLEPYVEHCPESLYLAERDGRLVGYLTGCPDPTAMPGEDELIGRALSSPRVLLRPGTARFIGRSLGDVLSARIRREPTAFGELSDPRWPAHLHVNVLPEARGTGAAAALMDAWLAHLAALGVQGCYLQTLVENPRAVRSFAKAGFVPRGPTPAVPGLRFRGQRVHQQTMVRTIVTTTNSE